MDDILIISITAQWRMKCMYKRMPVKNIMTKLLKEKNITPYAFWKAMGIGQNTAYRICNDPESIPTKKIMDKIYEVYNWLPGDYLVGDEEWDAWLKTLSEQERKDVLDIANSYLRKTKDGRWKKSSKEKVINFPKIAVS